MQKKHKKEKVNIGIVGLGYWGPNLLRNFAQVEGCNVTYACDLKRDVVNKLSMLYPNVTFTTNYKELLDNPVLNAIAIATPVSTHFELARLALEHGKHVFLEKPMASSSNECEELITLARRCNLLLAIDHTFLFTDAVRKIKELVKRGEVGDLYYFDSERVNLGLIQQDINVIWDLAPHDVSIMNYIFKNTKPISVFATGAMHINKKVEELAHITIMFESGAVAHIHVSWLSPVKIRKILIGGSKKMVVYDDIEPFEKVRIYDKGIKIDLSEETPFDPVYRSGDIFIPKLDDTEALKSEAQHFINCIKGKEQLLVDGASGLEVVRILEACDKSIKEGKKINL